MPRYDVSCPEGHEAEITARWDDREVPCATCGQPTVRVWRKTPGVIPDDVPGGFIAENGFETPTKFYSKSEHRHALAARGLTIRGDGEESSGLANLTKESLERTAAMLDRIYGPKGLTGAAEA